MQGPNSAKRIAAAGTSNTRFNPDLQEKESLWIRLFTTRAKRVKIGRDKFYKTQAECCRNLMNTPGQSDLAEMLFGELI